MAELIGQIHGYCAVSWSVEDVVEVAEDEGIKLTEEDSQALLCQYEDAIYEAGYYAQKDQIKDILKLRKEREAEANG